MKTVEYKTISETDIDEFNAKTNRMVQNDWEISGDVSSSISNGRLVLVQRFEKRLNTGATEYEYRGRI